MPILQMLFYFDQTEGDNVTFSEDLYLVTFRDPSEGTDLVFFSPVNFVTTKVDTININTWHA